ncbi:MAG: site-specific tyrosine recombinase/integron integrase [Longimicrobiales bacterium]
MGTSEAVPPGAGTPESGRNPPPPWLPGLLERVDREMRIRNYSPKTRKLYVGHLDRFYRGRAKDDPICTTEECKAWLAGIVDGGRSHSYMSQALSALKFLHEIVLGVAAPVPRLAKIRRNRPLPTVLSREEVRRLIHAARNPKERALLLILYSAGLRVGEAVRLRVADVDSDRMVIHVRSGKGRKDRVVMLADVALEALRSYWRFHRPRKWLFPGGRRERHLNTRTVQRMVTDAARRAGIRKRVTPHTMRHSFATHLLENGTDLRYIQRLLGHKKSTTTEIYTHVADRDLARIKSPADLVMGGAKEV